jgi:hypothetical protein
MIYSRKQGIKEAMMTFLVFISLLVIAVLAVGLGRDLASYTSRGPSGTRFQKTSIVVAKATSTRKYFRRYYEP